MILNIAKNKQGITIEILSIKINILRIEAYLL